MPVFFRTPFKASFVLPEQVSTFPDNLAQILSGLGVSLRVIAVGRHLTAPTRVHSGGQRAEFVVRHEPAVRCPPSALAWYSESSALTDSPSVTGRYAGHYRCHPLRQPVARS